MSLLNTYLSYHQIHMSNKVEEKMAFILENETFWYKRIPFSLKM